ncbi:MAG: sulfatase-like hydrolase/transferase [Pseudomonadales bacterium]|nr:sulfatase-like hydrolase/transferase [Pseudomonadales bacterium]MDG2078430.1 sulfatase-like hydrolase/transferase [Pseudomonadales bacterium]
MKAMSMFDSFKKSSCNVLIACFIVPSISGANDTQKKPAQAQQKKPNILWIVSEDNSPLLGAYGDTFATTPHIDQLAQQSLVYDNAFANTPVCAPTRFSILTGLHASVMGTGNMRSRNRVPAFVEPYTHYLQAAGYYVTNDSKTDYNYATVDTEAGKALTYSEWQVLDSRLWNEGSYTDRAPEQPFFHVYNIFESHESRLHSPIKNRQHDPTQVTLPPYHPDTPEIRADWAQYYDRITQMDALVGKKLAELKAAGELGNTIVFYYSDHGGALARSKRFVYDTGTKIPFMVYVPTQFKHLVQHPMGERTAQIIDLVDLAPTLLYLAGVESPDYMHGENIFSANTKGQKEYAYLYRGRMDVRIDLVRALRGKRFKYIRNYMPQRPNGQHLEYLWKAASVRSWQQKCQQGQCNKTQQRFWQARPAEELYDTHTDKWEVNNLAVNPLYKRTLLKMRAALKSENRRYKDVGFIPEGELAARTKAITGYELVRQDGFPIELIIDTAEIASLGNHKNIPLLSERLEHPEASVRYWSALGLGILKEQARPAKGLLEKRLQDSSADVQIAAAEALIHLGDSEQALGVLITQLKNESPAIRIHAANALQEIGSKAKPVAEQLQAMVAAMEALKAQGKLPGENYLLSALSHTVDALWSARQK